MTHQAGVASAPKPAPMWIPTPDGHVFAWYHAPTTPDVRRCAVLLCDPFGWNRMALHLTYRHTALRLADAGFPVLRVDYPGTCDSEGTVRKSVRLETWLNSLDVAADRLKAWSGASDLGICGMLLGGTLGVLLAKRRRDVSTIVLWEPFTSGRTWLRTGVAATATVNSNPQGLRPSTAADGDREVLGFLLTRQMIEDVSSIDLLQTSPGTVRSALILPRSGPSSAPELARHFASGGVTVDLREKTSDSLDDVLLSIGAGYPRQTIEDIAAWMIGEHPHPDKPVAVRPPPLCPPEVRLQDAGNAAIREAAVFLGPEGAVFGIVSEPADRQPSTVAVVLLSAGANHRSGINRNYTEWARSLAMRGHRVLRIDIRGLGDSPPSEPDAVGVLNSGNTRNAVLDLLYRDDARQDVLAAVYWLLDRGAGSIACVGLCAGSYQAFHAALSDPSIASVVMLNPLRFRTENPGEGGDLLPSERWGRAIRGRLNARERVRRALRFARGIVGQLLPSVSDGGQASRWIARSFLELNNRGVDVCVVYNDNELMLGVLRHALRPVRRQLDSSGRFRIETVGHADHIYSPLWVQEAVSKVVLDHIRSLTARAAAVANATDPPQTAFLRPGQGRPSGDAAS